MSRILTGDEIGELCRNKPFGMNQTGYLAALSSIPKNYEIVCPCSASIAKINKNLKCGDPIYLGIVEPLNNSKLKDNYPIVCGTCRQTPKVWQLKTRRPKEESK